MRASHIPLPQLEAIAIGALGFREALLGPIEDGIDPDLRVLRVAPEGHAPRWYIEVRGRDGARNQLIVDKSNRTTMAALVPIYLVDHVQSVREEMADVFALDGFEEGISKLVPWEGLYRPGKPS